MKAMASLGLLAGVLPCAVVDSMQRLLGWLMKRSWRRQAARPAYNYLAELLGDACSKALRLE